MKTKLLTMLVMLAVAYAILMIGIDREDSRIESQKNAWQFQIRLLQQNTIGKVLDPCPSPLHLQNAHLTKLGTPPLAEKGLMFPSAFFIQKMALTGMMSG